MCDSRENVFTQLAKMINDFTKHKITKYDMYEGIIRLIEMADSFERVERIKYLKKIEELQERHASPDEYFDLPYSNYNAGLTMLDE